MVQLAGVAGAPDVLSPVVRQADGRFFVPETFTAGNKWSKATLSADFIGKSGAQATTVNVFGFRQAAAGLSATYQQTGTQRGYLFSSDPTADLASSSNATFIPGQGSSKLKSALASIAPIVAIGALPFAAAAIAGAVGGGATGAGIGAGAGSGLSATGGGLGLTAGSAGLAPGIALAPAASGLGLSATGVAGSAAYAGFGAAAGGAVASGSLAASLSEAGKTVITGAKAAGDVAKIGGSVATLKGILSGKKPDLGAADPAAYITDQAQPFGDPQAAYAPPELSVPTDSSIAGLSFSSLLPVLLIAGAFFFGMTK